MKASQELEEYVDECVAKARLAGYEPRIFVSMRGRHSTLVAMEKIVQSGDIQSGFKRLAELGLAKEWSIEACILKFKSEFSKDAIECALWRLKQLKKKRRRC
jgi:hypothetical protein